MGVDFTAVVDHSLDVEQLMGLPRPPRPGPAWTWELSPGFLSPEEELAREGRVVLESPTGSWGWALRSALSLVGLARWASFVRDPPIRDSLVAATRTIARLVGGTTIVYLSTRSGTGLNAARGTRC